MLAIDAGALRVIRRQRRGDAANSATIGIDVED
jgi:hypothetical protein